MRLVRNDNLCEGKNFELIFEANYKALSNYLNYRFKDYEIAEEYAQNAFLILWENCGKIKPIQAKKFLFTTSYRLVLNHLRRTKVERKYKESSNYETIDYNIPDLIFDENALNNKIYTSINALPEKQRIVFMMNRFENQTYVEIAEILNISVKSVEKRMQRALNTLKNTFK